MATEQTTLDETTQGRPTRACPHCDEPIPDTIWPQHVRGCPGEELSYE